jgi:hypothetical protein
MPFYKLLKEVDRFQWTMEAQEALEALNKFLTTPPVSSHRVEPWLAKRPKTCYYTSPARLT